jgi:hypothetical protein
MSSIETPGEPETPAAEAGANPPHKRSLLRAAAQNIGVVLFSTIFCLCAVEAVLRITTPREIMRYFFVEPDYTLHHRFIPGATGRYESTEFNTSYHISSVGLRDREFGVPKNNGVFRILMLGDSFTEGDGVEANETFSKRLEGMLQEKFGHSRVEVVNAGVGSYSPLLEYLYLMNGGIALQPDLVILNYDLSDTFDDISYTSLAHFDVAGRPMGVAAPDENTKNAGLFVRIKDAVKNNTRLYNFIRLRIDRYLEGSHHEGNFGGNIQYDKYALLRNNYQRNDRDWELSERYLLMIRDTLRSRGIDFWVNVYPYGMQVSPKEWAIGRQFWGFRPDTLYSTWPQEYVESFCKSNGIRAINMCGAFRDTSRSVFPLYWPDNGHWVPRAHQVVAEIFDRKLELYVNQRLHENPKAPGIMHVSFASAGSSSGGNDHGK